MILKGKDSEKMQEMSALVEDASLHKDWKEGGIRETKVGDISANLNEEIGWLWMRGK